MPVVDECNPFCFQKQLLDVWPTEYKPLAQPPVLENDSMTRDIARTGTWMRVVS